MMGKVVVTGKVVDDVGIVVVDVVVVVVTDASGSGCAGEELATCNDADPLESRNRPDAFRVAVSVQVPALTPVTSPPDVTEQTAGVKEAIESEPVPSPPE